MRRLALLLACALHGVLAVLAAGCGGGGDGAAESVIPGDTLTVYVSVPLRGPLAGAGRDVRRGAQLALAEAGGRAGPFTVTLDVVDPTDPDTGRWSPERVAAGAREALRDQQTVAFLGELEHGASAVSVPLTNSAGILHVTPRDTFAGLTEPGALGEPERFYPSGRRTFLRTVEADVAQAALLARALRGEGRVVIADDRRPGGLTLADRVARLVRRGGGEVVERVRLDPAEPPPAGVGRAVREGRAGAFLYTGAGGPGATGALRAVAAGAPRARLLAADDLALEPGLAAALGPVAARRLELTTLVPPAAPPRFAERFTAAFGAPPGPQAVHGYRAMRLVLRALARAGDAAATRSAVVRAATAVARAEPPARFSRARLRGDAVRPSG